MERETVNLIANTDRQHSLFARRKHASHRAQTIRPHSRSQRTRVLQPNMAELYSGSLSLARAPYPGAWGGGQVGCAWGGGEAGGHRAEHRGRRDARRRARGRHPPPGASSSPPVYCATNVFQEQTPGQYYRCAKLTARALLLPGLSASRFAWRTRHLAPAALKATKSKMLPSHEPLTHKAPAPGFARLGDRFAGLSFFFGGGVPAKGWMTGALYMYVCMYVCLFLLDLSDLSYSILTI